MPKRYGRGRSSANLYMGRMIESDRKEMATFRQWLNERKALTASRDDPNVDEEIHLHRVELFDAKWSAYENGKASGPTK